MVWSGILVNLVSEVLLRVAVWNLSNRTIRLTLCVCGCTCTVSVHVSWPTYKTTVKTSLTLPLYRKLTPYLLLSPIRVIRRTIV